MTVSGADAVLKALAKGQERIVKSGERGLLKAGLLLEARAKELAPLATGNLTANIAAQDKVQRTPASLRVEVTALATASEGEKTVVYSANVHENMEYDGPNVGGSRTQQRGELTLRKGTPKTEPSDGTPGGKYLERPLRNRADRYQKIINDEVTKELKK